MRHFTLAERLRYRFDNTMSRGTPALIAWLGIVSLLLVTAVGLLIATADIRPEGAGQPLGFAEAFWESLMRTLDPGTMGGDAGWSFRFVMFVVTLGGIFIVSTLIGVLSSGIEARIEELRKGRSVVVESGHTLILGWSAKVFTIARELIIANENRRDAVIVVLADRDKVEMEDELAAKVPARRSTRIVVRRGDPCDMDDLALANPGEARSIVVLKSAGESADHAVIKTLLALLNGPFRDGRPLHIVTELDEPRSLETVDLIGRGEVEAILSDDVISRVMVQTSRQSGLSVVFVELLNFDGDEIYFQEEPGLVGKTFGDALSLYEDSAVIGIAFADGAVSVNPPMGTRFRPGDRVIAITRDDDTMILNGRAPSEAAGGVPGETGGGAEEPRAERLLLLGWNRKAPRILEELARYVSSRSAIHHVADIEEPSGCVERMAALLAGAEITFERADITRRDVLERIGPERYDGAIVLSPEGKEIQAADAETLVTLLNLRDLEARSRRHLNIVSEMLDEQNRRLAEVAEVDDFVVGDVIVSLLLAQVSENKLLMKVFRDLLDADGSEIYMKPAAGYAAPGVEVDFHAIVAAARRRGQCAIGYRRVADARNAAAGYGVVINPRKSDRFTLSADDKVIVVSED